MRKHLECTREREENALPQELAFQQPCPCALHRVTSKCAAGQLAPAVGHLPPLDALRGPRCRGDPCRRDPRHARRVPAPPPKSPTRLEGAAPRRGSTPLPKSSTCTEWTRTATERRVRTGPRHRRPSLGKGEEVATGWIYVAMAESEPPPAPQCVTVVEPEPPLPLWCVTVAKPDRLRSCGASLWPSPSLLHSSSASPSLPRLLCITVVERREKRRGEERERGKLVDGMGERRDIPWFEGGRAGVPITGMHMRHLLDATTVAIPSSFCACVMG